MQKSELIQIVNQQFIEENNIDQRLSIDAVLWLCAVIAFLMSNLIIGRAGSIQTELKQELALAIEIGKIGRIISPAMFVFITTDILFHIRRYASLKDKKGSDLGI